MKLKSKVTAVFLSVALIPFILGMAIAIWESSGQVKKSTIQLSSESMKNSASRFSEYFKERKLLISVYADTDRAKSMDWDKIGPYLKSEVKRLDGMFEKLLVGRRDGHFYNTAAGNPARGNLVTENDKEPGAKLSSIAKRDYWKKTAGENAKPGDPVYVSDPMISMTTGARQIMVAGSMVDGNAVKGMISGSVTFESVSTEVELIRKELADLFGDSAKFCIVTHSGMYLYHWDEKKVIHLGKDEKGDKKVVMEKITEDPNESVKELGRKMLAGEEGFLTFRETGTGSTMYAFYGPIKSSGYSLAMFLPESYVLASARTLMWIMLVIIVLAGAVVIYSSVTFARKLNEPIQNVVDVTTTVAAGDLTVDIQDAGDDEMGMMLGALKNLVTKVHGIIRDINQVADQLSIAADDISATTNSFTQNAQDQAASAEEVTATIEEISSGVENVANGTSEQSRRLESLLSNINELSGIIHETENAINSANRLSTSIAERANRSSSTLGSMSESMKNITESSKKMGDIIVLINNVSEQINLLSLNAAIEAARAGDAGRGFAVVADEISKLADETSKSIRDIESLIKMNENEINTGLAGAIETVESIGAIIKDIGTITDSMANVSSFMHKQLEINDVVTREAGDVQQRADEIRIATEEQKTATTEIVKSVTNINDLTQSNASGTEELAAKTEEFSKMADSLMGKIRFFKV
ncbi:MAG TPA: methyl-accepting chemotaxis protein [Spirochaetes bacterium]|nr:methyl-accepting chemotaxis protein [Spirochaetota bacterium]